MRPKIIIYVLCFFAFCAHAAFAVHSRPLKPVWANVPPVPSHGGAAILTLGDEQFAYRAMATMIQNLGDSGGEVTPLYKYDYDRLGQWFNLADSLDRTSNHIPILAAYYFGATQNPDQLDPVIDYLAMIGQRPYSEKWRWLAQAVYLARFRQEDYDKAMGLAQLLAAIWHPGMPGWARQMPAFVAAQMGDKQASYEIMLSILKDEAENMHPAEVNFMVSYICERLLDPEEAAKDPVCGEG